MIVVIIVIMVVVMVSSGVQDMLIGLIVEVIVTL